MVDDIRTEAAGSPVEALQALLDAEDAKPIEGVVCTPDGVSEDSDDDGQQYSPSMKKGTRQEHRKYTVDDHRSAYEAWRDGRTFQAAADVIHTSWKVVRRWAEPDFRCEHGCQWHGWENLKSAETLKFGQLTTLDRKLAGQIAERYDQDKTVDLTSLVRSEIEELVYLEMLRAKAYYLATGDMPDVETLRTVKGGLTRRQLVEMYDKGPRTKSFESAVRTYLQLSDQVEQLKERSGLKDSDGAGSQKPAQLPSEFTIDDARLLQQTLQEVSHDGRMVLAKWLRSEGGGGLPELSGSEA